MAANTVSLAAGVVAGECDDRCVWREAVLLHEIVGHHAHARGAGHGRAQFLSQTGRGGVEQLAAPGSGPEIQQVHARSIAQIDGRSGCDQQRCHERAD
jgi:hypothetical protein